MKSFPIVAVQSFVEATRDTGYKSTGSAIAELVDNALEASAKHIDITIEQWSVLYHLWKEDGQSQQQLCDATFRDKPSITRLVDNLEKLKLVKRIAAKDDRRKNLIYLTKEAQILEGRAVEVANQTLNESLEGVTNGQIEIAKIVLQKVYDNLTPPAP